MRCGVAPGGSAFAESADRPASRARLIWDHLRDPSVLTVETAPPDAADGEAFDISRLPTLVTIVVAPGGGEHVALSDGLRRIRIDVADGTLLQGPVRLRYRLADAQGLDPQILTMRRLLALRRTGRFAPSLFPRERMAAHWAMALRASDALAAGASQRDLAGLLFGALSARTDWRGASDFLRLRVQRLVRIARRMTHGGHFALLR
jgi:hypothetical protein